jgi:hypothetical protein
MHNSKMQGRRNRGGQAPQVLPSALFPGAKCPFLAWKMSLRLHFLPKGHLWKLEFMLFPENFFNLRGKYHTSGRFFCISGKCFSYLGKNVIYPEIFFGMFEKIFWEELPPRWCPFFSKSAPQSLPPPPQLLGASYAPAKMYEVSIDAPKIFN